jgi:hypothetical protein
MDGKMVMHVLQFKGEDAVHEDDDACSPTIYESGKVELFIPLVTNQSVYVTFDLSELVRIALQDRNRQKDE